MDLHGDDSDEIVQGEIPKVIGNKNVGDTESIDMILPKYPMDTVKPSQHHCEGAEKERRTSRAFHFTL